MTPFSKVYNLFLSKVTDDMYMELTPQDTKSMLNELLESAISWFEFPRKSLDTQDPEPSDEEDGYFVSDLDKEECNILATYMIKEWVGRQLASCENTRMKYSGSDFKFTSQANHMAKLQSMSKEYERQGFHLQRLYKRRKKDSKGIYRSTMHVIMDTPVYPFSRGNEDPATSTEKEVFFYEE